MNFHDYWTKTADWKCKVTFKNEILPLPYSPPSFGMAHRIFANKFAIDKALDDLDRDVLPVRCSSAKLRTFWGKNENGEWVKGVDAFKFLKHLYHVMLVKRQNYSNQTNKTWLNNEVSQEKMNNFIISHTNIHMKEEYQTKAIKYLIFKTLIDKNN